MIPFNNLQAAQLWCDTVAVGDCNVFVGGWNGNYCYPLRIYRYWFALRTWYAKRP